MAKEIERKYIVINDVYKTLAYECSYIKQGYISTEKESTIRIRIIDKEAFITIKGITIGITRNEWEYKIPYSDACEMLDNITKGNLIEKRRYYLNHCGYKWEIDEFLGSHAGLVIAEIELKEEDEIFPLPVFVGKEVTDNPIYYNSTLALIP